MNIEEGEIILIELTSKLIRQNPNTILKSHGLIGAENLLIEHLLSAKKNNSSSDIHKALSTVFEEYGKSKYKLKLDELEKLRMQVLDIGKQYPPEDENSIKKLTLGLTGTFGFFVGLSVAFIFGN
jgi:hypothetical protein